MESGPLFELEKYLNGLDAGNWDSSNSDTGWQSIMKLANRDLAEDSQVHKILLRALQRRYDAVTRAQAAEALGDIGARSTNILAALKTAVTGDDSQVKDPYRLTRAYATKSLGILGDKTLVNLLTSIMRDESEFFGVRAEAVRALGGILSGVKEGQEEVINMLKVFKDQSTGDVKVRITREAEVSLNQIKGAVTDTENKKYLEGLLATFRASPR